MELKGRNKQIKNKNKKVQIIIGAITSIILFALILCGASTEILNQVSNIAGLNVAFEDKQEEIDSEPVKEFVADNNLKVYFLDVGQADSILVINGTEAMLIDAGNNEDGKDVVKFIQEKGIKKLNYVVRNPPT